MYQHLHENAQYERPETSPVPMRFSVLKKEMLPSAEEGAMVTGHETRQAYDGLEAVDYVCRAFA